MSQDIKAAPLEAAKDVFNMSSIALGQNLLGDFRVGTKHIQIDGKNKRIVIYDEDDVARVLIGFQENGF